MFDDEGEVTQHIPIPVEITTGRKLVELFKAYGVTFPIKPKVQVIAASGDEERVQALFSDINVNVPMQRRAGGRVSQQVFAGKAALLISVCSQKSDFITR